MTFTIRSQAFNLSSPEIIDHVLRSVRDTVHIMLKIAPKLKIDRINHIRKYH